MATRDCGAGDYPGSSTAYRRMIDLFRQIVCFFLGHQVGFAIAAPLAVYAYGLAIAQTGKHLDIPNGLWRRRPIERKRRAIPAGNISPELVAAFVNNFD